MLPLPVTVSPSFRDVAYELEEKASRRKSASHLLSTLLASESCWWASRNCLSLHHLYHLTVARGQGHLSREKGVRSSHGRGYFESFTCHMSAAVTEIFLLIDLDILNGQYRASIQGDRVRGLS